MKQVFATPYAFRVFSGEAPMAMRGAMQTSHGLPRTCPAEARHASAEKPCRRYSLAFSYQLRQEKKKCIIMDVTYINPFIESTQRVFQTMLHVPVEIGKPQISKTLPQHDVSGIIGMSGDVVGVVVLSFPRSVAKVIVGKFAGMELPVDGEDFADAVGELINMISGAAKSQFEGKSVSISCPSVILGSGHQVAKPSDTVGVSIPCSVYCGQFSIDVAIRPDASAAAAVNEQTLRKSA
jgi:chemotaxis protein CheX